MRRLVAALSAAVVLALLGLGGAPTASARAGSPAGRAFPPIRPTRVLVLGDSVMKGAAGQYAAVLPGREVVVDAEVNRTTGQGADVVARLGADWDVVVILLGHNDGSTPGAYQPAARRILDQLVGVRRVIWLTIHEVRPYYPGVNQYVAGLQETYPNLRTADWNAVASAHPEGLAGDGLHLNGTGAQLMADLVAEQVKLSEIDWYGALKALAPATTTTTTAPPTTTTTAPTTTSTAPTTTSTTAPVTTTVTSTTTAPGAGVLHCISGPDGTRCDGDDGSDGTPVVPIALGVGALGAVGVGLVVWRRRQRRTDPG